MTEHTNKFQLIGEIADPIKFGDTKNGSIWCNVTLLTRGDKGTKSYHRCKAFGDTAELLRDFHEGDTVELRGRLQNGSYEKKDGTKVYTYEPIIAKVIEVAGAPKAAPKAAPARRQEETMDPKDIPF
jgi:single-stranded DNA-binding protein